MRRIIVISLLVLLLLVGCSPSSAAMQEAYEEGYAAGKEAASVVYNDAYDTGFEEGYAEGLHDAWEVNFDDYEYRILEKCADYPEYWKEFKEQARSWGLKF